MTEDFDDDNKFSQEIRIPIGNNRTVGISTPKKKRLHGISTKKVTPKTEAHKKHLKFNILEELFESKAIEE